MFEQENNGNWKGGICSIRHVDELTMHPEYVSDLEVKIARLTQKRYRSCWLWLGMLDKRDNRAYIKVGTRRWPVARILMFLKHKSVGKLQACHSCDNPQCVNPKHIWLGTCKDNQRDKWNKGRVQPKIGEQSPVAKLSESDVISIRSKFSTGSDAKTLAAEYSITVSTVYSITSRKRWKHVK